MSFFDGNIINNSAISQLLVQLVLILLLPRILHAFLSRLYQPLVVSEIIAGLIWGPSVLGQIPGFTNLIFPPSSIPPLEAISQLALVLFLFMVGLNLNTELIQKNIKPATTAAGVGVITSILAAIPIGFLFHHNKYSTASLPVLIGFIAIVINVSALAVMARILGERGLVHSPVGTIALSASALDTFDTWIFMAIVMAFASKNSNALHALYTMLLSSGQALLMWFVIRPIFKFFAVYARNRGTLDPLIFTMSIIVVFAASWLTDVIGISALFGAFEAGLVYPRKGLAFREMRSKLEDVVVSIFMPVFAAYSGLRTNFTLLRGLDFLYIFLVLFLSGVSKGLGSGIVARIFGLNHTDSILFSTLMICKGLVVLVILNLGMDHDIISGRTFSIFIIQALVIAFFVTPSVVKLMNYQKKRIVQVEDPSPVYKTLVYPQQKSLSASMATVSHYLTASFPSRMFYFLRYFQSSDKTSEILCKLNQDVILRPGLQRAKFLKLNVKPDAKVSFDILNDLLKVVEYEHVQLVMLGCHNLGLSLNIVEKLRSSASAPRIGLFHTKVDVVKLERILLVVSDSANSAEAVELTSQLADASIRIDVLSLNALREAEYVRTLNRRGLAVALLPHPNNIRDLESVIVESIESVHYSLVILGLPHTPGSEILEEMMDSINDRITTCGILYVVSSRDRDQITISEGIELKEIPSSE